MKALIAIIAATSLTGCAELIFGQQPIKWYHATKNEVEFEKDKRECSFEAEKAVRTARPGYRTEIGAAGDIANQRLDLASSCLRSRGYWS